MQRSLFSLLTCLVHCILVSSSVAAMRLPRLVSNHMVLQRNQSIPVWGWADPNERVSITFANKTYTTKAGLDTRWRVDLPAMTAGGPYTMTIRGKKNTVVVNDILLGDVWLGSGQSNMEWQMKKFLPTTKPAITAANFPNIRLFDVRDTISPSPLFDVTSRGWQQCSPETVADFSAVAYYFGRDLYQRYQVPIGLITSDWGGTQIEAWMSPAALRPFPEFAVKLESAEENPGGTLEQIQQGFGRKLAEWQRKYTATDRGFADKNKPWSAEDIVTTDWKTIALPAYLEQPDVLPDFDGIVWVRKQFTLTPEQARKSLVLHLAHIDDVDSTWFNGQKVGGTSPFDAPRVYTVPGHLVKAGLNTIVIRILDTGGGGGLYGAAKDLYAMIGPDTVSLAGPWVYQVGVDTREAPKAPNLLFSQNSLMALYNGMIAPLIPYALKGVIWYQGEANADRAYQYRELFTNLIQDWRTRWGYKFSFLFVQLAGFMNDKEQPADYMWAELREAQTMALRLPKTGMAVAIDIGDSANIHPVNKQEVGHRLALAARRVAYGELSVVSSGPIYKAMTVEGKQLRLSFDNIGSGLTANDRYGYVRGFTLAGPDRVFHWARGWLEGNELILTSDSVPNPVAVRYDWGNTPDGNLFNREGLPAVPFRTDDWPGLTFGKK